MGIGSRSTNNSPSEAPGPESRDDGARPTPRRPERMDEAELAALRESARLGDAARAALTEAEGRWRQALGTAAQERLKLRAEIGVLRTRGRDTSVAPAPAAKRQRTGGALQAAASSNTPDENVGDPALSRTEVYAKFHEAEAALRVERERASEAEGQLELVLEKLQKQLPVYHDKTERLRHALASNESLSGRLAAAIVAEQKSKAEAARLQLEVQVQTALAKELTGELASKLGGSAEGAVQQVVVIQEELLREQLGGKQRETEAVANAERPLLAALEAAKREGAEARRGADQLVEVQAQMDRWRVLYEGSVASLVAADGEQAAAGGGPTAADKAEVLALLRAGCAGQAGGPSARLQASGGAQGKAPAASGGAAQVEALRKQLGEAEERAEKLRKAAAHWKAQHGKLKETYAPKEATPPTPKTPAVAQKGATPATPAAEEGAAAAKAATERVASLEAELEAQRSAGAAAAEQLAAAQADAKAAQEAVKAKEAQVEAAQAAAAASAQAPAASTSDEVVTLRAELLKFKKAASHWKTQHDQLKGGKGGKGGAKGAGSNGGAKSGAS